MKKLITSVLSFALIVGVSSCGEKEEVKKKSIFGAFKELAEEMEDMAEDMENNSSGDGEFNMGIAINHKDLKAFLPTEMSGYKVSSTTSSSTNTEGLNVGMAEIIFSNDESEINVEIIDYFAAATMFKMASLVWKMGIEVDSDEEIAKSYVYEGDYTGWLNYDKMSHKAEAVCGINNRIIVTVGATNQDDYDRVVEIIESMDLDGISKLGQSEDVASN